MNSQKNPVFDAKSLHVAAIAVSLSLISAIPASAISTTWTGSTSTDFQNSGNWGGTAPTDDLTSSTAVFINTPTTNQPTLTGSRSIAGLDFESTGWTLGGSTYQLTIGSGGIVTGAATGTNTITANLGLGAAQTWSTRNNALVVNGAVSGTGALTIGGTGSVTFSGANTFSGGATITSGTVFTNNTTALGSGAVSVAATSGTAFLQLSKNLTVSNGLTVGGTTGATGIVDTWVYMLTAGTTTLNSGGVLQLSGTGYNTSVNGKVVVNNGGTIRSWLDSAYSNTIQGDVTLNSGAVLTTNSNSTYTFGYSGRIAIAGNLVANAGSTIADNPIGFISVGGTSVVINSGVTWVGSTSGASNSFGTATLVLSRGNGTTTLSSASVLDQVWVRDQDKNAVGTNYTAVISSSLSGQNIGQIMASNVDGTNAAPGSAAVLTVRMGSNLSVINGKGILSSSAAASTKPVTFDLNGYVYDASAAAGSGIWAPNQVGTQATNSWTVASSSGTGTFRAGSFDLSGSNTDVTIGSNVILDAVLAGGTTDLGLKAGGSGTAAIDATSTFSFAVAGSHTLRVSGTYANGSVRPIGNLLVGSGSSASTLILGSAVTTGSGSTVTVNKNSTLALGANNLNTNGTLFLDGGAVTASTGFLNAGGDITVSGTNNSSIGSAVALGSATNRNVTVSNTSTSLTISGGISGNGAQLTKLGVGSLILSGSNTYSGATTVRAGNLDIEGRLVNSAVTVNSGAKLSGIGVIDSTVTNSGTISGNLTLNNDVTINAGATAAAGAFNGNIVNNGTITSAVNVQSTRTLSGTGSVTGAVTVKSGGTTSAGNGNSTGKLTLDLSYDSGATANFNVSTTSGGNSPVATKSSLAYSQIVVSGSVGVDSLQIGSASQTLTNGASNSGVTLALSMSAADFATLVANATNSYLGGGANSTEANYFVFDLADGLTSSGRFETLTLDIGGTKYSSTIYYSGANDRFNGVANLGDVIVNGQEFAISYTGDVALNSTIGGNDIVLTAVPEPSVWGIVLAGMGTLLGVKRLGRQKRLQ